MGNKMKIISSIASLCLVIVAVTFAVVNIFSASSGTVGSTFTVNFTALGVDSTVSVKHYQPSNSSGTALLSGGNSSVTLNTSTSTCSFTGSSTAFSLSDYYVVYEYCFVNNDTSRAMTIAMSYSGSPTNVDVYYGVGSSTPASGVTAKKAVAGSNTSLPADQTVSASSTLYIYMVVEVHSYTSSSSFSAGNMSFTLSRVTPSS